MENDPQTTDANPSTDAPPKKRRGRPPGALNKSTLERRQRTDDEIKKARESGILPLDWFLKGLREEPREKRQGETDEAYEVYLKEHTARRDRLALMAAPFIHAKLAQIDGNADASSSHEDALDELE